MTNSNLLEALLDSWDRNNNIMLKMLLAIPENVWLVRATENSPSIAELYTHIHFVRLATVAENIPEFVSINIPEEEWVAKSNRNRVAQMLNDSAKIVHDALKNRIETNQNMSPDYDHPIHFLAHMVWHEGYHLGQIKLVLKTSGYPMTDKEAGPLTWNLWRRK